MPPLAPDRMSLVFLNGGAPSLILSLLQSIQRTGLFSVDFAGTCLYFHDKCREVVPPNTQSGVFAREIAMAVLETDEVSRILGGKRLLRREIRDHFDLIELGARGIPKSALMKLADYLHLSRGRIAQLLSVSERTIQRHGAEENFSRAVSEQILHIAEVAAKGTRVFEDRNNFLAWLNQPSIALANEAPIDLLKSRFGADMVFEELVRMEHGIFA